MKRYNMAISFSEQELIFMQNIFSHDSPVITDQYIRAKIDKALARIQIQKDYET